MESVPGAASASPPNASASSSTSTGPSRPRVLPDDYTFLNPWIMISKKAKEIYEGLEEEAEARDPDAHGVYIYNGKYDFKGFKTPSYFFHACLFGLVS